MDAVAQTICTDWYIETACWLFLSKAASHADEGHVPFLRISSKYLFAIRRFVCTTIRMTKVHETTKREDDVVWIYSPRSIVADLVLGDGVVGPPARTTEWRPAN